MPDSVFLILTGLSDGRVRLRPGTIDGVLHRPAPAAADRPATLGNRRPGVARVRDSAKEAA